MRHLLLYLFFLTIVCFNSYAQCPNAIDVNLTANPGVVYSSSFATIGPLTSSTNCCPSYAVIGDRCIKFSITLNPGAAGIRFEMNPLPSGANVYRVNCGSTTVNVGSVMCLNGPGPHILTFCNPAAITSLFKITSIPKATAGADISISQGCSKIINALGFDSTTVVWKSITNNPTYNSYLSCTNCLKPTVTAATGAPSFVDYQICGNSSYGCGAVCDTIRVFFTPPLAAVISPPNPTICNGQTPNSTNLSANGIGGSGTYTYLWNNINASQTITVPAGFYTVVVSDGTGCTASSIIEVKKFTIPVSANAGLDKTVCRQIPVTTLNGSVNGAYGGVWSGGGGIFSPNNGTLTASYTPTSAELSNGFANLILTSTGTGTCVPTTDTVKINYVDFTGTVNIIPTPISCFGGSDGSASISVTGGSAPHTYSWNTVPLQSTATATNLGLGTYSVTVTNSIGCTSTASALITQPTAIALGSSITAVTCSGGSNGGISITANGGTPPYTYLWQPGNQTTAAISGKQTGSYSITVTDSKNCQLQSSFIIPEPPAITVSLTPTAVGCFNGTDGKANSTVSGGTPPYSFSWSSGATSPNVQGLPTGNYTLTVTDNVGCTSSNSVLIPQPSLFTVNVTATNQSCSYSNDGSATTAVVGGTPGFSYLWQPGGLTASNINNLASGTYTVVATDSKGCSATGFATVNTPLPLAVNFISQVNVSCFSGNDGFVTASASGGTFPYSYTWASGGGTLANRTNLQAGTYTVTATDSKGCTVTNSVTLTQPAALLTISSANVTDVSCNGGNNGSVALTAAGGTPPYSYLWLPGGQTTATATNLIAGTYTVTVKDSKGCQINPTYIVSQPSPTAISFSVTPTSCANGNDGALTPSTVGGTTPFTYSWMPGSITTNNATGLSPGTYTLTLTDAQGCVTTNTSIVTQPPAMLLTPTITNVVCSGSNSGAISVAVAGGLAPYTYFWPQSNQTTASITNIPIGTYSVTVTDSKGCQVSANYTVTQLSILITLNPIDVSCFGGNNGSVSATIAGGTPNFTYSWMPGGATTNSISNLTAGTYTLSVTDFKGCLAQNTVTIAQPPAVTVTSTKTDKTCSILNNGTATAIPVGGTPGYTYLWQPGLQTTETITNLATGTYSLTIKDSKGCLSTTPAITTIGQPAPLLVGFSGQQNVLNCNGDNTGAVGASISGGTPAYTYLWTPGSATTSTISNLLAGTYSLTVTDNAGCTATNSVIIAQPQPIAVTINKTNESCNYRNDGTANATVTGGTAPYTYVWQPGAMTTASVSNLSAGTYSVLVTDAKGCNTIATIAINEPSPLVANFTSKTNVSCFGGTNGSITVSGIGGTPNYSYLWTPGNAITSNISNVVSGVYKIKITDTKGCIGLDSIAVTQPPILTINVSGTNKTCSNLNNGTATANGIGGIPTYTYLWQPGLQTTSSISNLSSGTYTVNVTDSAGCIVSATKTISQPAPLVANFTGQINVSTCYGDNNGSVSALPSGGTPNYFYVWSPGGFTTNTISNLVAGTYSLTVTDNLGCVGTNSVTITQPTPISANISKTNETCNYNNDGTATVTASGGTPGYLYSWQPGGATTANVSGLSAGTYTVIVTDSKGCSITKTVIITEPLPLVVGFSTQTNVSCSGGNTGAISSSITGGTANYTYLWTPGGATTANRNNLTAGTYSLNVTDSKGCIASNSVILTEPTPLSVTTTSTNSICSNSNNGTATAIPVGGTPTYTYSWAPGLQTTIGRTGLAAGTYTVTVKDSKGCITTGITVITAPAAIAVAFTSQTNVSCNGGNDGAVTASPSGGTSGYTYLWTPGGATTPSRTNLTAGSYSVTVTDSKGCSIVKSTAISQPTPLLVSATGTNETCNYLNNGTSTVTPSGGTPAYTYLWQPGAFTTNTLTNLSAGTYTLTVTDAKGCTSAKTIGINEPAQLTVNFNNQNNVSCFGGNDGAVAANIAGGTQNYFYSWAPGGATTNARFNLTAGSYTLTVNDRNGCTANNSVTITQPAGISSSTSSIAASCYDYDNGSASVVPIGGMSPYTYNWSPGNITTSTISGLHAGTYTVTATDSKGCNVTNTAVVAEPSPPVVTTSTTNSGCNLATGSGTITLTGGTAPYSYLWTPGGYTTNSATGLFSGHYDILVTDANSCTYRQFVNISDDSVPTVIVTPTHVACKGDSTGSAAITVTGGYGTFSYLWSPIGGTGITATGLPIGVYTVKVSTSPNGCKTFASVKIRQPTNAISLDVNKTDVSCFGGSNGSAIVVPSGGVPGYTYLWQPGEATTSNISNLISNTYTIQVSDTNGCSGPPAIAVVTIAQPIAPITVSTSSIAASCFGKSSGSVTASNATGGNGAPYSYLWTSGNSNGQAYVKIAAGTYTITVKDSKGCIGTNTATVEQPPPLVANFTNQTNVSCYNANDGSVTASPSGGTPGYTYFWMPSGKTTALISGLSAGKDSLIVTDINGCIAANSVIITQPAALTITTTQHNETCDYLNNGSAAVHVSGSTPPYSYSWQPVGLTSDSISNLTAQTYTVNVTDMKGCTEKVTLDITQPQFLGISFSSQTDVSCFGGNNGSITGIASGGTTPYSYSWSPGLLTTSLISGLTAQTYTLTVLDTNSCITQNSVTISQPVTPISASISKTPVSCFGGADGTISCSASGGTPPYDYTWMPGNLNGKNLSNLTKGTYTVTINDSKGCIFIDSITVPQFPLLVPTPTSLNSTCSGANGQASVAVVGGVPPYNYEWLPSGGTAALAGGLLAGTYTVSVTDSNLCNSTASIIVNDNPSPVITIPSSTNISCYNAADGTATSNVVSSFGPFIYSWMPSGGTNAIASGLIPGTYTLTVTDTNLCQSLPVISPEITQPAPLLIQIQKTNVSCFGGNTGSASVVISGGTAGYTYLWTPGGATTSSITGLSASTYSVTVTDAHNCSQTTSVTITQPLAAVAVSLSTTPVSCFGGTDGTASALASGGTGSYDYLWMPSGVIENNLYNVSTGTFTLTATDLKGCSVVDSIMVTQPPLLVLNPSSINSNCSAANGQASVAVVGGTGTYTYNWQPSGGTNSIATGLMAGSYSVVVTDSNSCSSTTGIAVSDNSGPSASILSTTNVSCNGGSDGKAVVSVVSSFGPFSYSWLPLGGTNDTAIGLVAGTYSVVVTDAHLCQSQPIVAPEITEPSPIFIDGTSTIVSCFGGNDGTASINVFGGTPGYNYLWLSSGSTGLSATNLMAGSYTVQVTDANSCLQTSSVIVNQPISPLSITTTSVPVGCFGDASGKVSAIATGGTPPYNYFWMPGTLVGQTIGNLIAGTYTTTVVDAKGCSIIDSVVVTEPLPLTVSASTVNSTCSLANGKAIATATGGTIPYSYQWTPSGNLNDTATGLLMGSYTVHVTDSNSCVSTASIVVNDSPSPTVFVSATTNITCNGGSNGTATAVPSGSSGPFTYNWLPSGGSASTAIGLLPGTYTVTVTDTNMCQSAPAVSTMITEPSVISITISTNAMNCFGGNNVNASAIATGGTPGYSYMWLPSGTTGTNLNALSAGNYSIQVTDANNCVQTSPFTVTEPTILTSSISSSINVSCFGGNDGSAIVTATGGTPFYSYDWQPFGGNSSVGQGLIAGTYTVTITDFNGCIKTDSVTITQPLQALSATSISTTMSCFGIPDGTAQILPTGGTAGYSYVWSPSVSTTNSASGLVSGNYNVIVTDTNNCKTNVSVTISEPAALSGILVATNPVCNMPNGTIHCQLSGGTPPYTYSWTSGQTTSALSALDTGTYHVQINDSRNCSLSLTSILTTAPAPSVTITSVDSVSCTGGNNGSAIASIANVIAPFSINWLPSGGNSLTATSLTAGTYTVNVTDGLGCQTADTAIVFEPAAITISIDSVTDALCNGQNSGAIAIAVSGGTGTYNYSWIPTAPNTALINNIGVGTYTVNVTDQNNCFSSMSVIVNQPPVLSSLIDSVTPPICYNGFGSASVLASGGVLPYSYSWLPAGDSSIVANNILAGSYTVTVTDANGCITSSIALVNQPSQVITSVGANDTLCLGQTAAVAASATGGAGNYYYAWQPSGAINGGTLPIAPVSDITYTVVAYDQIGCSGTPNTVSATVFVLNNTSIQAFATSPICPGQTSVVYVETTGITGDLTYQWNNGLPAGSGVYAVTPSQPTTYIVTVSNLCTSVTDSVTILFNPPPTMSLTSDTNAVCVPGSVQFFDNSITGNPNDPITIWNWNFGDGTSSNLQNPSHNYTSQSDYPVTLTIITSGGCTNNSITTPLLISAHLYPTAAFSLTSNNLNIPHDVLNCSNQSTGASSYIWNFGNGESSTQTEPQFVYSTIGTYTVQLIAISQSQCTDTAYAEVSTNTDIVFPSAFTPNLDAGSGGAYDINGLTNDVFFPYVAGVVE
jgi:hypothetical protein